MLKKLWIKKSGVKSMDKPVISISIATHNNGVYLNKAISSCLEQDFKLPYEVIVIADACNDNTKEVVESLMKTHKNLFYYEVNNKCVLKNRIYASKIAKGEFNFAELAKTAPRISCRSSSELRPLILTYL